NIHSYTKTSSSQCSDTPLLAAGFFIELLGKSEKDSHQYLTDLINNPKFSSKNVINIIINSPYVDDLTLRNHHLLNIADVIIYPPDLTEIINLSRRDAKRVCINTTDSDAKILESYLNDGNMVICLKLAKTNSSIGV
ncbi:MAG: hypothetical protein HRU28_17855, partial [Rhizobiales bacterium]|nr:hypothetical protein [Hyphomicrobiales bacterium]